MCHSSGEDIITGPSGEIQIVGRCHTISNDRHPQKNELE